MLSYKTYAKKPDWGEKYKDGDVKIVKYYDHSWDDMFSRLFSDERMKLIIDRLSSDVKKESLIYPKPEFVLHAFLLTALSSLKVVFIGQDPYFNFREVNDVKVPEAYGLSFSVPCGVPIPSSLSSIFNNLVKNKHMSHKPENGCLDFWAYQGCLMLNTALTVIDKQIKIHSGIWKWFTDYVIKYISSNKDYLIFVLWGADAFEKTKLIDLDKHDAIITSHPSGRSADKPLKGFPAFNDFDHFGEINTLLKKKKMTPIIWQL
uniref:Uracil-DNA glycosylase-like domain-containing protein n=1 Tax=viral metagenome TaxID=1070528 RepID=A0A6C0ECX0_9ZZZZ